MDEIDALTRQYQVLDEEQSKLPPGPQKTALQKAAGKVKNQLVTLLNSKGVPAQQEPQQQGPNIPDPASYFNNGNSVIDEYFNNLTPDMERYFTTREDLYDGAPSMPVPTPTESRVSEDEAQRQMRIRILHAIGVF
ncbi:hypothetical protein BTJ78_001321 [Escherichia coli]|nr:hypothetical protein [Escherichia coli]EFF8893096.1 hypothetical protein [Escherichia coli]